MKTIQVLEDKNTYKEMDFITRAKAEIISNFPEKVRYVDRNEMAVKWGGHDDPEDHLQLNEEYDVKFVEPHSSYTSIGLKGINGRFNSVHFQEV